MGNLLLSLTVILLVSGCATVNGIESKYMNVTLFDGVSKKEAKIIAQNELLKDEKGFYKRLIISRPYVTDIDWSESKNKLMKEKIPGYYQKYQDNWSVEFPSKIFEHFKGLIGCVVWVDKVTGDTETSCSQIDL